ncbi:unnamed protein product [Ceratitis capitata]|uniref:(Mediterranean fruit fly) hypothetical protein n=1 Tax=Ceratitis capitata TaxID=7213 RepID=A0A811UQX2_CERCA|nr:unnamed protein product [Ceratitis capitata]
MSQHDGSLQLVGSRNLKSSLAEYAKCFDADSEHMLCATFTKNDFEGEICSPHETSKNSINSKMETSDRERKIKRYEDCTRTTRHTQQKQQLEQQQQQIAEKDRLSHLASVIDLTSSLSRKSQIELAPIQTEINTNRSRSNIASKAHAKNMVKTSLVSVKKDGLTKVDKRRSWDNSATEEERNHDKLRQEDILSSQINYGVKGNCIDKCSSLKLSERGYAPNKRFTEMMNEVKPYGHNTRFQGIISTDDDRTTNFPDASLPKSEAHNKQICEDNAPSDSVRKIAEHLANQESYFRKKTPKLRHLTQQTHPI